MASLHSACCHTGSQWSCLNMGICAHFVEYQEQGMLQCVSLSVHVCVCGCRRRQLRQMSFCRQCTKSTCSRMLLLTYIFFLVSFLTGSMLKTSTRVSNTSGNRGNLLELFFLLEIFWKFAKSPGNFLAEFVCAIW